MSGGGVLGLIARKRDGEALTSDEVAWLIAAYLADDVDDAQMAALLMAGVLNGFTDEEAAALTRALVASGRSIDLSTLRGPTIDKHSTGGVGDVTTLVVAPLLAAAGYQVAKLSGRGLGHTGGTLDKLEAIPGYRVDLSVPQLLAQVERVGLAVAAASTELVPADRRLYALRDVTGTVEDAALIASSVMSKKLAGGAAHILLDVKVGSGAFMPDLARARELARRCVAIGRAHGRRTAALLTQMDEPAAPAVGNALEVAAAVEVLQGGGSSTLRELCLGLATAGRQLIEPDVADHGADLLQYLHKGDALEKFREWIGTQGGDAAVADDPWSVLPRAPVIRDWYPSPGIVQRIDGRRVGEIARGLGAGRRRLGDVIDPAVGLEILVRTGQEADGQVPGARIHAASADAAHVASRELDDAVEIGDAPGAASPLILDRIGFEAIAPES